MFEGNFIFAPGRVGIAGFYRGVLWRHQGRTELESTWCITDPEWWTSLMNYIEMLIFPTTHGMKFYRQWF